MTDSYIIGGGNSAAAASTGTQFLQYGGTTASGTTSTEGPTQYPVLNAVTIDGLFTNTVSQTSGATGAITSRVGGAAGNLTISYLTESTTVPAQKSDTTHSDSVSAGNLVNLRSAITAGNNKYLGFAARINASTPINWLNGTTFSNTGRAINGTATQFWQALGACTTSGSTTEASAQVVSRAKGSWKGLFCDVTVNTTTHTSTVISRINAANGNQTISFASGGVGQTQDTTHSDTLTGGEKICYAIAVGDTSAITMWGVRSEILTSAHLCDTFSRSLGSSNETTSSGSPGTYWALGASMQAANANENLFYIELASAVTLSNMRTQISSSRASASWVTRIAGVTGNQVIAPFTGPAFIEDVSHLDSVVALANVDTQFSDTGGGGAVSAFGVGMSISGASSTEIGSAALAFGSLAFAASGIDSQVAGVKLAFGSLKFAAAGTAIDTGTGALAFGPLKFASAGFGGRFGPAVLSFGGIAIAAFGLNAGVAPSSVNAVVAANQLDQLQPLTYNVQITDPNGYPSPEFMRKWQKQFDIIRKQLLINGTIVPKSYIDAQDIKTLGAAIAYTNAQIALVAAPPVGIGFFIGGLMLDNELLGCVLFSHNITFSSGDAKSIVEAQVPATADAVFNLVTIALDGTQTHVGTITMPAGQYIGTVAWDSSPFTLPPGLIIAMLAPSPADATLAFVTGSLNGALT